MKRLTRLCLIGLIAATTATVSCSHVFAVDVFSDDFNSPNGPLIGTNADQGGTWAQTGTNATNPIQTSAGSVALQTIGQDAYAAFSSSVARVDGFGLKTSFDLTVTAAQAAGDYFLHLSNPLGSTTNFYQRLFARSTPSGYQLGLLDTAGTGSITTWGFQELSFGSTYHVDVTWNFPYNYYNDRFSVALDNVPYLTHSSTVTSGAPAQLAAINLRQGNSTTTVPTLSLDNLVVTTVQTPPPFDIYTWEYINPADPSQGKQQSTTLSVDGAGVTAYPVAALGYRDLTMAYLSGKNLRGAWAYQANLTNADLTSADLRDFNASNVNLTSADLSHADITNAYLGEANLTNADLSGAQLTNAYLKNTTLTGANFSGAEVRGANLHGYSFSLAQLASTASYQSGNLTGIVLSLNDLTGANFTGKNLAGATLDGTTLTGANFRQANLTNAILTYANLADANFSGAEVRGANFWFDRYSSKTGITLAQLYSTASYQAGDLAGINLSGGDNLNGANLVGMNLAGAALSGVGINFSHANLTGAGFGDITNSIFTGAEVRGANFSGGVISFAQLASTGSYQAHDLTGIFLNGNLTGWNLAAQNLTGARFGYAMLNDADLSQANLTNGYFQNASLTHANLSQANLTGANLNVASLTRANLSQANLIGANLTGANLTGANLSEAILTNAFIHFAKLSSTHITLQQLYSTASYKNHELTSVQFVGNELSSANFVGQTLVSASFYAAKLVGADFTNANLTYAELVNADLSGANLTGANFTDSTLALANLSGANLTNANLSGTNLIGANLTGANIRGANLSRIITAGGFDPGFNPKYFGSFPIYFPETQTTVTGTGITLAQLVSTASYGAHDLSGVTFLNNNFNGGNLAGFNLTNANFTGTTLVGADFSDADARGASGLGSVTAPNFIHPDGHIVGLLLGTGKTLAIRDYDGTLPPGIISIHVDQQLAVVPGATLQMIFDADAWDSTLSFATGIPATLGGTLELVFAPNVNLASQIGRTFDAFDWSGVSPVGTFTINSPYTWDLSNLYTTGEVTFLASPAQAIPEPTAFLLLSVGLAVAWMTRRTRPIDTFATPLLSACRILSAFALLVVTCDHSLANPPEIHLTKIGAPIWKPVDFQLFSAPATPFDATFGQVYNTLLPNDMPLATTYVPHAPPYDNEFSAGLIAGGYVSQSVFTPNAITLHPNGVYFAYMLVPDPGITGSSRDFAAGPVIPNSLFPLAENYDVWLDGVLVDRAPGADTITPVQPKDVGHDGTSHLEALQVFWHPWDDDLTVGPLGNYDLRASIRDVGGSGWDVVAPFKVIPELPGDFNHDGKVDGADYVAWRKNDGSPAGYNLWRSHFGQTAGSGFSTMANAAVPEPSTLVMLVLAAAGVCSRRRRAV